MSDPGVDPTFITRTLDWLWAALACMAGLVWKSQQTKFVEHEKRMDAFDAALKTKADDAELTRQRANIDKLFEGQRTIDHTMTLGFSNVLQTLHSMEISLIGKINDKADKP